MSSLRDVLVGWIDERTAKILATPRAWGSDEAVEMQVLLLLELRAVALSPQQEAAAPGRLVDAYAMYLSKTYPTQPHRSLCQIVEPDPLGQNVAAELRKAVDVFTRATGDSIDVDEKRDRG